MTAEEIEAIKYIYDINTKADIQRKEINTEKTNGQIAIETILNLIQKQQEEIELLKEQKQDIINEYGETIKSKDKQIDSMNEYIYNYSRDKICTDTDKNNSCNKNCRLCIKQYFERKAEEV